MNYNIQTLRGRRASVLKWNGLIDIDGILELREAVDSILEQSIFDIIVDLTDVHVINSAAWGVFISKLAIVEKHGGQFRFACMRPDVFQIYELLGLSRSSVATAYETVEEAIEASAANVST